MPLYFKRLRPKAPRVVNMADAAQAVALGDSTPRSAAFAARFGAALVAAGALDRLQLARAERAQAQSGERFDAVLIGLGLISEDEMARHLAVFLGLDLAGPERVPPLALLADRLDAAFLRRSRLLPIADDGRAVTLATADPFAADSLASVGYLLGRPVRAALMPRALIERAIERLYAQDVPAAPAATATVQPVGSGPTAGASESDLQRLEDIASDAPVVRLVQDLVTRAWEAGASDIHIEPGAASLDVRLRIDGVLTVAERLAPDLQAAIASRLKVMAELNIADRRMPQDGRIRATVRGNEIDLRLSTMPTIGGVSL